jgi:hypothetical protein
MIHKNTRKTLNFIFLTSNEVYFKWEMPLALEVIKDLRVDDQPEVKLIKHICWNEPEIKAKI